MAVKFKNGVEVTTLKVTTSPTAGSVLTADAAGNATWQTVSAPAPAGALIDGGSPTTNHVGNLKVDFGSVT